jgi:hypothetical protein
VAASPWGELQPGAKFETTTPCFRSATAGGLRALVSVFETVLCAVALGIGDVMQTQIKPGITPVSV